VIYSIFIIYNTRRHNMDDADTRRHNVDDADVVYKLKFHFIDVGMC
jgi:hypothetical protein